LRVWGVQQVRKPALRSSSNAIDGKRSHGFDHDELGKLFANGKPRVTDLANEVRLAGQKADDLIFAEAEFSQATLYFRHRTKLFNAHGDAGLNPAKGANLASGLFPLTWLNCFGPIHKLQ